MSEDPTVLRVRVEVASLPALVAYIYMYFLRAEEDESLATCVRVICRAVCSISFLRQISKSIKAGMESFSGYFGISLQPFEVISLAVRHTRSLVELF